MAEFSRPAALFRFGDAEPKLYGVIHKLEAVAYHEAGHAVLCRLTHRPFQTIVIGDGAAYIGDADGDTFSYHQRVKSKDASFLTAKPIGIQGELLKPLAASKVCVFVAGLQAELILCGEHVEGEVFRDDFDHRNARQLCAEAFGSTHLLYFQTLTRDYLTRCWSEVVRTAEELLARHDHDGLAVIRLADPCDASFFDQDSLPTRWVDEIWD